MITFDTGHIDWFRYTQIERVFLSEAMYLRVKRLFDQIMCLLSLPVVLPVFLLCILLIKLESPGGPAIFTQYRTGKHGYRFRIYKFRTMVPNAEEMKRQLAHLNELQWPDFKITNDPRITRIGYILRKTSLDELPQIINILKGEMSLVGPRPTSFDAATYQLWHTERLDVTPGLTGLWQIFGRAQTEFDDRLRYDIAYIKHRCLTLDLIILFHTCGAVFTRRGAY